MSNYHVLESSEKDHEVDIVFHIPIPNENSSVSDYSIRTALTELEPFTATQVPWGITTGAGSETEKLQNGELYELKETVEYDANMSDLEKQTKMDNKFTSLSTNVVAKLHKRVKYYGINRDVP